MPVRLGMSGFDFDGRREDDVFSLLVGATPLEVVVVDPADDDDSAVRAHPFQQKRHLASLHRTDMCGSTARATDLDGLHPRLLS